MSKPYIICHMMTSLDGRIDCAMVGQLEGVREYYTTLDELELSSTLSGRVTAQTEMALSMDKKTIPLKLKDAKIFENGAVWLRYLV